MKQKRGDDMEIDFELWKMFVEGVKRAHSCLSRETQKKYGTRYNHSSEEN